MYGSFLSAASLSISGHYRNSKQKKVAVFLVNIRNMTSTEVSTALRPFYFTVHPDLFGQYPSQRVRNTLTT